jgi:penicillin-binding protein-related factor A (putative recombinase)
MNNFTEEFLKNIATNKVKGAFTPYNKNYLVHFDDLFKYLVITKDDKRLLRYLKFVKQRLIEISERAYTGYLQKVEDLKQNK